MDTVESAAVPPILDPAQDRLAVDDPLTPRYHGERLWLAVMAACIAVEFAWWAMCWTNGWAPPPMLGTYALLTGAGFVASLVLRLLLAPARPRASMSSLLSGLVLVTLGASLFLPLKFAIPKVVPFWFDAPLASGERALFGGIDPWRLLDHLLGWASLPADRIYGLWLPVQTLAVFAVMLEPASRAKSRALIAYSLTWLLLGVGAALALSSAGPIFFDRLYGGTEFAPLAETLRSRGAWVTLAETDRMWAAFAHDRPGLVSGISAAPSLHVAISLWMWLTARTLAPRAAPVALAYTAFVWIASVQLGWHYAADGALGIIGMFGLWSLAGAIERSACRRKRAAIDSEAGRHTL